MRIPETGKMRKEDFLRRTMEFGLRIIRLVNSLPKNRVGQVLGNQLLRCGTSVGQTTVRRFAENHVPISLRRWELSRKNATKLFTGWRADRVEACEASTPGGVDRRRRSDLVYRCRVDPDCTATAITFRYPHSEIRNEIHPDDRSRSSRAAKDTIEDVLRLPGRIWSGTEYAYLSDLPRPSRRSSFNEPRGVAHDYSDRPHARL